MCFAMLQKPQDVIALVREIGMLPFFRNRIEGFSIEECCPRERWFSDMLDGPWDWKGAVASDPHCVYGKFFGTKAGFVSTELFPDLANLRRDGYDFEGWFETGRATSKEKSIMDELLRNGTMNTKRLKSACNYRKGGNTGFDTVITRLQMCTFVIIGDFEYAVDRYGNTYGWGIAQYTTPEERFGEDFFEEAYTREPEESRARLLSHLRGTLKNVQDELLLRLIG